MAYFESVNRSGGVNGKRIEIRTYDDSYDPAKTIQNTIRLVEEDALLLFNYVGTPTVTRMLPLLNHYRDLDIQLFFPHTGAQPQRQFPYRDRVFNLRASYDRETEGLVDKFVATNRKKIAIFYQADAYGRSGWNGVQRGLEKYGLDILEEATYRRGADYDTDLSEQVELLRAVEPDAVIVVGSDKASAAFIRDARDADWDVPISIVSFVNTPNLLSILSQESRETGRDYDFNLVSSEVVPSYKDLSLPAVREYRNAIDRYNPEPPQGFEFEGYRSPRYSHTSFEGFLNAKLLVEILKNTETKDGKYHREALVEAAESLKDFDLGIGTPISFNADDRQALNTVYYTTVENGRFVPLHDWEAWAE